MLREASILAARCIRAGAVQRLGLLPSCSSHLPRAGLLGCAHRALLPAWEGPGAGAWASSARHGFAAQPAARHEEEEEEEQQPEKPTTGSRISGEAKQPEKPTSSGSGGDKNAAGDVLLHMGLQKPPMPTVSASGEYSFCIPAYPQEYMESITPRHKPPEKVHCGRMTGRGARAQRMRSQRSAAATSACGVVLPQALQGWRGPPPSPLLPAACCLALDPWPPFCPA